MSRELIGNCGYTVGERGYFERINKALTQSFMPQLKQLPLQR